MNISGLFNIGRSALTTATTAMNVTGENISNVNTPGYNKQSAVIETSGDYRYGMLTLGTGSQVSTIKRAFNSFLNQQLNFESANYGQHNSMLQSLSEAQIVFGDASENNLGAAVESFFNAWQDLSANPTGMAERQTVISNSNTLVDTFHQVNNYLTNLRSNVNSSITSTVSSINDYASKIATLNDSIRSATAGGSTPNSLMDQRDQLVTEISQKIGVSATTQADGSVTISVMGGPVLVSGNRTSTLSVQGNPANSGLYDIYITPFGSQSAVNLTSAIANNKGGGGELGGMLQTRDVKVSKYLTDLDELASSISTEVNSVHSTGFGTDGSTGLNFFSVPTATPPATFQPGFSGIGGIQMLITDPNKIAAASADPTAAGNGAGNNQNALNMIGVRSKNVSFSSATTTLEGFYGNLVGVVGVDVQNATRGQEQSDSVIKQVTIQQQATSGVSLDEETANLIQFQKAFEGAAKMIQVGSEMLDTLLSLVK